MCIAVVQRSRRETHAYSIKQEEEKKEEETFAHIVYQR
jgi:hypothetical protein